MNQNPNLIPLRQFATMAEARAECARIGITPARSLKETQARLDAHHVANPEHHQPCQGCETIKAEAALAEYRVAHPEIAAEGAKMCDCDPVGDAAREHYQGLGKQPCDCQPEADYSGIEARTLAHDIEAAKRDTPPSTTPAYGVLTRRMMTMLRNQPKASVPGSVRRRMQREAIKGVPA